MVYIPSNYYPYFLLLLNLMKSFLLKAVFFEIFLMTYEGGRKKPVNLVTFVISRNKSLKFQWGQG